MPSLIYQFKEEKKIIHLRNGLEIEFPYPCDVPYECSPYQLSIPTGIYKIELYGASGGTPTNATTIRDDNLNCMSQEIVKIFRGNSECNPMNSPGAGGYISGVISLFKPTTFFLHIGGKGEYRIVESGSSSEDSELPENRPKGGYNGGGDATGFIYGSSGGGGGTDIRAEVDDYWHRIIVAGGGGGIDDMTTETDNDGSGGAGGYPKGQNCFIASKLSSEGGATQDSGYSFFQGESAYYLETTSDLAGSGGGWFGGSFCKNANAGGSGGSSYILTNSSFIPTGNITVKDKADDIIDSKEYAFNNQSPYLFYDIKYANGIRSGDGFARLTIISQMYSCIYRKQSPILAFLTYIMIVS